MQIGMLRFEVGSEVVNQTFRRNSMSLRLVSHVTWHENRGLYHLSDIKILL